MEASFLESLEQWPDRLPDRKPPRRMQVLILDDDETDRMRLTRVLRRAGLEVDVTEIDDVAGLGPALDSARFDIVFIDYWLGFENGLDALALLSAHFNQARAVPIMLSRATEPHVIVEAMRAGCADYIVKDELSVDSIRACIASAFERRIMLNAMREGQDLRFAIRRLIDRLAQGRVPGLSDTSARNDTGGGNFRKLDHSISRRLSAGLLADLELLWHLRRGR